MARRIVTVQADPDLPRLVAGWLFAEFGLGSGPSVEALEKVLRAPGDGFEETFVLYDDDVPVGTASLVRADLDSRPDLTPWLAGVLVQPAARGRGHASVLVRHVEAAARAAGVATLWLYTWDAAPLYEKLGWTHAGPAREWKRDKAVLLMRRDLSGGA